MGYFVATKFANVYQVSIKKQYGASTLALTQLSGKPGGAIASIFSMIGVTQGPDESQHLAAMTSGPRLQDQHGRWDLFVMTRKSLFQWHLYRSGECTLEVEVPLRDEIKDRILDDHTAVLPMGSDPSVRVLDIQYIRSGKLLVFATFFNTAHRTADTPLACALFTISCRNGSGFDIDHVKYLQRTIVRQLFCTSEIVHPQKPCMKIADSNSTCKWFNRKKTSGQTLRLRWWSHLEVQECSSLCQGR